MEIAYLHIITNHIPIIGVPFAIALMIFGIWRKSDDLKAFGMLVFVFLGIATLGVYFLGQGGEDFVEELAGVSHDAIEDHEEMGLISLIFVGITAVLSLFGLIFYKGFSFLLPKRSNKLLNGEVAETAKPFFPNWLIFAVLGLSLLSAGILGYTGKLGGKIRHTEFYGGMVNAEENEKNKKNAEQKDNETEESGKGRGRGRGGR